MGESEMLLDLDYCMSMLVTIPKHSTALYFVTVLYVAVS